MLKNDSTHLFVVLRDSTRVIILDIKHGKLLQLSFISLLKKGEHVLCIAYLDLPFSKENEDNSFFLIPAGTIGKGSEIKKSFGNEP